MYEDGFESLTLLNYLLSIGTSKNLSKEKNIDLLVNNFNINSLASSSPKFSINVLKLLNKNMLQSYDFSDVKQKFIDLNIKDVSENFWIFIKNNINYFSESLDWIAVINSKETYIDNSNDYLNLAAELLPEDPYDETTWDVWTDLIKNQTGKKGKELFMPIRLALTGRDKGPELKYLLPLLTKKHILKKLGNI